MIDIEEYVENVLYAAVKVVYPSVERLVYEKYDHPMFRKHDSVHVDLAPSDEYSCGKSLTLDVTGMNAEEIRQTVSDALSRSTPKRPLAATDGGSGACPKCKQLITNRSPHCEWCGQAIDWRI